MSADNVQTQSQARAVRSGDAYRAYAATKPTNLTPARTHVNSAMTAPYKGNNKGNNMGTSRPEVIGETS